MMNRDLEDQLYARVAQEVSEGTRYPAPMARATEKSAGNSELAKSLYIKFRVEQIAREVKQEERRKKLESDRIEHEQRLRHADEARKIKTIADEARKIKIKKIADDVRSEARDLAIAFPIALIILIILINLYECSKSA